MSPKLLIISLFSLFFTSILCQEDTSSIALDVPYIKFGEKQDYEVLSFETLKDGKYSILYSQELPATVMSSLEFGGDSIVGAYEEESLKNFIPYSNRVLILVRQTFDQNSVQSTDFWVLAIRDLKSDYKYHLYFPYHFAHPIIADEIDVTYSLKYIDLIKGLTPREFEALTLLGKNKYNFYTYPEPSFTIKKPSLFENLETIKNSWKELNATLGKGNIPKEEKLLFKRKVKDKIRMVGTVKELGKDSVTVNLYVAKDDNADYESMATKSFSGDINPSFSTDIFFDENMQPIGAYGYLINKFKDSLGEKKNNILAIGLDQNGEPNFWKIDAGKNKLGSFNPEFSFLKGDELFVLSYNNEKVFKSYAQMHRFEKNGSTTSLYPTIESEINSEKFDRIKTYQRDEDLPFGQSTISGTRTTVPFGFKSVNGSLYYFYNNKYVNASSNGESVTTTFGNLSLIRMDRDYKVKEILDIEDNRGAQPIEPELISSSTNSAFFLLHYPKKLKLTLLENAVRVENFDTKVSTLVKMINNEYVSRSTYGSLVLHKTIMGNQYKLEIFPNLK